jgi:hypothetical protein
MLDDYKTRSDVLAGPEIPREALRAQPLGADAVRALRYMESVESYTLFYLKSLLSTRAAHEPEIASFLAGWLYEETGHGLAISALLEANGTPIAPRAERRAENWRERITAAGAGWVSRWRSDFPAVHMLWGALCARLARDEARHFTFYFEQARRRLAAPRTQRLARWLVGRFWAPVGSGVVPDAEVRFLASYLFSGDDGRAAAQKIDETIRQLPGLGGLSLLENWLGREAPAGIPSGFAQTVT